MQEMNLFWFGLLLELGFVVAILLLVRPFRETGSRLQGKFGQLKQDYHRLQQDLQQDKMRLMQECDRLRQELQRQQDGQSQIAALEQKVAQLTQECHQLQQSLQQQESVLTQEQRQQTFSQLQTLLINYPSAVRIVEAKPDLPAKNLLALFTPLENLLQDWGYEAIGSVWQEVAFSPQLHHPDVPDIQPGEPVYIRFIGYRQGNTILCPAKVSRTLPEAKP
jgi:molecular chaperone GrpE (heat shock protein)